MSKEELLYRIATLEEENKLLKTKINKANKHIKLLKEFDEVNFGEGAYSNDWKELLEILSEEK